MFLFFLAFLAFLTGCHNFQEINTANALIEALPEAESLTLADEEGVVSAGLFVEGLPDAIKAEIKTENLAKLDELKIRLEQLIQARDDQTRADEIANLLDELPLLEAITLDNASAIQLIRSKYEDLSLGQKTLLGNEALSLLEGYEAKLEIELSEQAQIDAILALLGDLPTQNLVTLEDEPSVISIRNQYDLLSLEQKDVLGAEPLAILEVYENLIQELKNLPLREQETFLSLCEFLEAGLPNETLESLELPIVYENGIVTLNLTWSSDSAAINALGIVTRGWLNTTVKLTALVTGQTLEQNYEKSVIVRGTRVVDMPNIDPNKKLTFAYFRDPAYGSTLTDRDFMKIDVLNYAFGNIYNNQLSIYSLSHLNDVLKLREKGVRIVISIDGVSSATRDAFAVSASTQANREALAASIASVVETYQLDGIDLDWEFPYGSTEKNNFTLLVKEIRAALDQSSRDLILSAAVISGSYSSHYDLPELNKYLDYLHIMTYGMSGTSVANHQSALYRTANSPYAIATSVEMYANGGIDRSKIVFGIPFYVVYGSVANYPANPLGLPMTNGGTMSYTNFRKNYAANGYVEYFDDVAKVYYSYSGTKFASYDNPTSIGYKCQWVKDNDIAGVMFWDYGHDSAGGTLLNAIYQAFRTV